MIESVLIIMYTHIEGYPPSLNAVQQISKVSRRIHVLHRNTMKNSWPFPENVSLEYSGSFHSFTEVKKKNVLWKFGSFTKYTYKLLLNLYKLKPDWLLIHEPVALLAWGLARPFYWGKIKVWYHNHDVILGDESILFKYAFLMQNRIFSTFDMFSLPAEERKNCFPMNRLNGKYFFIPNYPGKYLYDGYYKSKYLSNPLRLIYQGHIGTGHGLEEIIGFISKNRNDFDFRLVLKGFKDEAYYDTIVQIASKLGVVNKVEVHGVSTYQSVPEIASSCHIGIGVHTKADIMNKTLGTASNKIYEYAALGLPVLLYDNEHFRNHLSRYKWAVFTDLSESSISSAIEYIISNYQELSLAARSDFQSNLNFEYIFIEPLDNLLNHASEN